MKHQKYVLLSLDNIIDYTVIGQSIRQPTNSDVRNDCNIYRQNIQVGVNMGTEIYRYQKFIVFALPLVKIFDFWYSKKVLIYY